MTNEELALKIQSGHDEYIPLLWDSVSAFIEWKAKKYLSEYSQYKDLKDDLINEGYFAMLEAVKGYKADKGAFTTYLSYHLKNSFKTVILGGRGQRQVKEPLNNAVSIDILIDDTEDLTLADMIIDETAEAYYRRLEDADFWENVRHFLYEAIDHVKNEKGQKIIRYMYENGATRKEAAEKLYPHQAFYEQVRAAFYELRRYMGRATTRKQMQLIGLDNYIYGWGVGAWKRHGFTSSVEYEAIRRVDAESDYKDIYSLFASKSDKKVINHKIIENIKA